MDVDKLHHQCDPAMGSLCLLGHRNMSWEVVSPNDKLPPKIPEPLRGINFARDKMERLEWLALVASSCDQWLLAVAFHYAAKAGFGRDEREQLFEEINKHDTVSEVFKKASKERLLKIDGDSPPNSSKQRAVRTKEQPPTKASESCPKISKPIAVRSRKQPLKKMSEGCPESSKTRAVRNKEPINYKDSSTEEEDEEKDYEDSEDNICGFCNQVDDSQDLFWIACDTCKKWFHGDCVQMNAEKAKGMKSYYCPDCCKKMDKLDLLLSCF